MKQLKTLYALALLLLLLSADRAFAINDLDWGSRLESARKLFYSGSFYAAEKAFDDLAASIDGRNELKQSEVEAYKVLCAIALDRVNIDGLVKVFSDKYPNAPELSMVNYALASNYFDRGRYAEADKILQAVNEKYLYKGWRNEFRFKKAFSEMTQGRREDAAKGFESIIERKSARYMYPSLYYLGYVNYLDRRFDEACCLFAKASADSRFSRMSSYYLLESKFMSGDYYYVVDNGETVYAAMDEDLKPNVARILSESYYSLGETEPACRYMDIYESSATALSRKDHYYSGMLAYTLKSYGRAVDAFDKVTSKVDSVGQSAQYYKANSHLRLGNKLAAMKDFKAAADMPFDKVVSEDAFFNYAKLSFDVNNDISQFEKYLEKYPSGNRADVVNNYMATAFIEQKDYSTAVSLLCKVENPTPEMTSNLQKAAFFRAMQLTDGGIWRSAVPMFELSIANGVDNASLSNLARFWEAECLFRDERYEDAIAINNAIIADKGFRKSSEYPMALYNQAYCYFKGRDYANALKWFSEYLSCPDAYFEKDARIRLADSHYMRNDYSTAASIYEGVVDQFPGSDDIYPTLQAALSYGLAGLDEKKLELLNDAVRNHNGAKLYPMALYELGRAYLQTGSSEEASGCFYTLLGVKSDSTFQTKAMLELAMINSNNGKYDKAIDYYKRVVKLSPGTETASNALSGLENIYQIINKPSEYLAYIDAEGLSSTKSAKERETMLFASAEQLYRQGNYASAMNGLQSYLSSYPDGASRYKASWLLAESLRNTGRKEAASDAYQAISERNGEYREASLRNLAQLSYELERYGKASEAYAALAESAEMSDVRCGAFSGKMRSDYRNRAYSAAVRAADSVLTFSHASDIVLREAHYVKAKALVSEGDRDQAMPIFSRLASDKSDAFGAESAYLLILNDFNAGDFPSVEERTYAFSDSKTPQVYWLAKSFIVLGDSFAARGEREQAEATYSSIVDGYDAKADDDIIQTAKARLADFSSKK